MSVADKIRYIVLHCTAGYGDVNSIVKYWREILLWSGYGYSIIVGLKGEIWYLSDDGYTLDESKANFNIMTNGVRGWNDISRHIAYIGGVNKDDYTIIEDSRTPEQVMGIQIAIYKMLSWLTFEGRDITINLAIKGHRDFSKDNNGNGIIDTWERVKECPSFETNKEYGWILSNNENQGKLPFK